MADYYPLIARAVAGLQSNTIEARDTIYKRARETLVKQITDELVLQRERIALENAIQKVEGSMPVGKPIAQPSAAFNIEKSGTVTVGQAAGGKAAMPTRIGSMNVKTQRCQKCGALFPATDQHCPSCVVTQPDVDTSGTNDTKSEYGERLGLFGRIVAVIVALFAFAAPVFCFFGFFYVPGLMAHNSGTLANNVGQTGSIIVGIILLAMAKEFWPHGLGALRAAFAKGPPSIHAFTEKGDKEGVEAQLAAGAATESRDQYGNTPLHIAAFKGQLSLVSALLAAGADVNAKEMLGETALHKAAGGNHVKVVAALLIAGANKETKDKKGGVPLHQAAANGSCEAIAALLDAGANKDAVISEHSITPLHFAAVSGHDKAVALLLAAGANKEIRSKLGKTALDLGKEKGLTAVVRALDGSRS